ncbi:probable palmitoyltransferase ZDHHC1 isoform X2 [Anabas testudineus]|uniref:Palmitoyltransferase n=1 Tax=Anabas testudineus TaxID=64144 RepID=A0A7N6AN52_ANATE|nr:probable palmitoyltransferase ZDHHC1 isoform X2 [Anabas testudineus]
MDVCCRNPNRTAPVGEDGPHRADVPLCSRTNGWSWPPHPFQLLAWLLYIFFAVTGFGVFVPLLPAHWIPAGYICMGVMFVCHLSVHVMAVSVDPADYNVRTKSDKGPVPVFDRSKHAHVIENCHCYLCQVDVGPKSKHCSACNKCVDNFDHHCRWLNNCVGRRNYKFFLHSVVSALLGVCLILVVSSYVFMEFFLDPSKLRTDKHFLVRNDTGVWFVFLPVAPLRSAAAVIPALASVTVALALLSSVLLCHLLCFHLYLMWNRLSTYEYIVRQRHRQDRDPRKPGSGKDAAASSVIKEVNYSGTLGYTNPQLDVQEPTVVAVRGEAEFLANGRVRSLSSPVVEGEAAATVSTEPNAAAAALTHQRTQKKKKKVRNVPAEVERAQCPSTALPAEPSIVSTVSSGQRLPFPAFPLRASLPPLAPVQAAGPPTEYHSDSAESLEEIPVALAKLGSSSSAAGEVSSHRTVPVFPVLSPQPRTKRQTLSSRTNKSVELKFEMVSTQPPTIFVSRTSGGGGLSLGRRTGSRSGSRSSSRPASRASLRSGLLDGAVT